MADRQEFREGKQQHRRRLLVMMFVVPVTLYFLYSKVTEALGESLVITVLNTVIMALVCTPVYLELRRLRHPGRLLVTVGDAGLGLRLPDESLQVFSWDRVRSFELPWHPGHPPDGAFVNVDHPRRGRISYGLPLNSFDPGVGQALIEALRRHWPDLDEPWQVQLARRNGLDSSDV
ncbi:hypothetical protein ACFORG_17305 [Lutimaribacter marinistellae]|uniref:Uncharacterized protein n=1 Tax=Lutimaribacter marinistellae TaxID=1820329 RepID=A0ABV7TJQ2_9RHOB